MWICNIYLQLDVHRRFSSYCKGDYQHVQRLWILIERRGTMWKAIKDFTLLISDFNCVLYSGAIASFHFLKIKVRTLPLPKTCVPLALSLALAPSLLGELSSQKDRKSLRSQSILRTVLRIDPASWDIKQPLMCVAVPQLGRSWAQGLWFPVLVLIPGEREFTTGLFSFAGANKWWWRLNCRRSKATIYWTLSMCCALSHNCIILSVFTIILGGSFYYPNFTDEDIEILGEWVTCRRS